MARKFDLISELYERTCKTVVSNPQNWQSFLLSACRNYKLRFDEQILVYAQRPNATAVLEIERWNKSFGRWVNRGAKGIAVFEDANRNTQRLMHYFDISDTHEGERALPVPIWNMDESYEVDIIETLESTFGTLENKDNLAEAIICSAKNATEDNISDYLSDLIVLKEDSFLEELDEDAITVAYRQLITNSVAFMIMSRLNMDTELFFDDDDFRDVTDFNTQDTLNALGYATSDIAEMGLAEIAKTVVSLDKRNRIIAENNKFEYNEVEIKSERSSDYERSNIHNDRRLQSSEPDNANSATSELGQIRTAQEKVPERASQSSVLQLPDEMQTDRTSDRGGTESLADGRNSDETDVSSGGFDRRIESTGYDDLGSQDEQSEKQSSGNRESGSDIQLEYFDRKNEDRSIDFFHRDSDIKAILLTTPHLKASKSEIVDYYETVRDRSKQTEYIKSIFNNDITELTLPDGRTMGYKTYQNVLHLWEGTYDNITRQGYYDWGVIAGYFEGMRLLKELTDTMKPLPSMEGQLNFLNEVGEHKTPVFTFSQEIIDAVLTRGSGVSEGKLRIYGQFQKSLSKKENIAFLKNEYGWGGSYPIITGTGIDEMHDGKGIRLSKGLGSDAPKIVLAWPQVEKRLSELMKLDRYLNPKEKVYYPQWLEEQERKRADIAAERQLKEFLSRQPEEPKEYEYKYHLGDKVYIGASEYEITSFDDNRVTLFDSKFPLFGTEMPREEFDTKVKENPMNDHLRVVVSVSKKETETTETKPIGRIDYLHTNGEVRESVEYTNSKMLEKNIKEENEYGVPMKVVFYSDENGLTVPHEYIYDLDPPIQGVSVIPSPHINKPLSEKLVDFYEDYDHYDYRDSLEIGETNEDAIKRMDEELSNAEAVYFLLVNLKEISQDTNLTSEQKSELDSIVGELESVEKPSVSVVPAWERPKHNKTTSFDLHPDIPYAQRHNFDLKSNEIETVGKKERFRRNMEAIRVLKECEFDNRFATPDEQIILSKYVSWGGIPEAFDENNTAWEDEFKELYVALSPDEYAQARESTLTAFYTPPTVIKAIYKAMEQVGFKEGNLLEPSCGIGHFIGMLPDSMKGSKIYGVELDAVSANIAQQLYQTSSIAAQGYEETNLPDSFFDGVIGNVPFGDFKVIDKRYDKHKFLIHDYFFAKSLDKLRPSGVMVLVTSKGTLDKENSSVRKYIAQRAELLGAIRLPNNTFKGNAGTEVVSDILFLQKRDRLIDIEPDWVHLDTDENGVKMNSYFVEHPEMVLGEMKMVSGRFGMEATCEPYENSNLENELMEAVSNIHGEITAYEVEEELSEEDNSIPADPTVRNFSYTVVDDIIYFRENSKMTPVEVSATAQNRIKGMIAIRDSVRNLIDLQTDDFPDEMIKQEQTKLNNLYDAYTKKYGLINSRANISAFSQDSSFSLLSALEVLNEDGQLERKADMFFKRTIKPHTPVTTVDTSSEALAVSIGEKATIDMEYMMSLTGKSEAEIFDDLKGVIFMNPLYDFGNHSQPKYLMADEYLSGNVREKLKVAINSAELYPDDYKINVEALTKVQPKDLTASEISVRLGATWLPPEIVERFMYEFLDTPRYAQWKIKVHFSPYTSEWNIENKSYDNTNVKAYSTYGTNRINAYKIIEETLNLKDVRIFDYVEDEFGKRKAVLNKKETAIAQAKQELIKQGFQDWIWADPQRREKLTKLYNEKFNSIRPREYDGSHITFSGMNPEIELREHQRNAVAHILYGGNTLLAHAVGAGKTFEMVAAAQESKRLGLCNKSLFVVPNHLTEQWAAEYLQLYPAANILVATKKDFETKNRKRFCGRIATGDYDAVIIGHSQFEKIPMSIERQKAILQQQLDDIAEGIADLKKNKGENFEKCCM